MSLVRRMLRVVSAPSVPRACGPCRRGRRRGRAHRGADACYGAVMGPDTLGATTWVSCPCRCAGAVDDSLDVASPTDDTVARVLGARSIDDDVDDPHRHSSTG